MKIRVETGDYHAVEADALVVSVFEGETATEGFLAELNKRTNEIIANVLGSDEMRGKTGDTVYVHRPEGLKAKRLLLIGIGKKEDATTDTIRRMAGTAVRFLRTKGAKKIAILRRSSVDIDKASAAFVEGAGLGLYDADTYKTQDKEERTIDEIIAVIPKNDKEIAEKFIKRGEILYDATNFARHLVNEPGGSMTPSVMASKAQEMAAQVGLDCQILEESRMRELGMGALLGVAQGSIQPPKLIILTYTPKEATSKDTIALVGKGVTFDSGGISIKPADGMEKMKYDMGGGAAVIGAMKAIAHLKPPVKVIGAVPAVENMPSGSAQRPGDVVRAMSGKTIEVINTDAEGRLILADALTYVQTLGATKIVDMATLTGACLIALGTINAAILGTSQDLVNEVIAAGKEAGEKFWQLPLDPEYREQIKSQIADIKNTGGRNAGTITAAYFLREFVNDIPWAHLDIAGMAWNEDGKAYTTKGPTGFPVRTLVHLVFKLSEKH
ncbi:MAG TPA: leucyl aminopeptidase [Blastocatellia bacterium]|nr:leucyl aminopeptidase [Blastocatellia bacterium]